MEIFTETIGHSVKYFDIGDILCDGEIGEFHQAK
jgi:hypothetical protein